MAVYRVQNSAMPTTAPATAVTTSTTNYTSLQLITSTSAPVRVIEWGVSFNGSALAAGFPCELVDTGTINATVTAYAAADVMAYDVEGSAVPQSGTATGLPVVTGTQASGYTSSAEGTATTCQVHDSALVEPIGVYYKQFPLGREPYVKPGNVLRIRIKGDGATTHYSYIVFET